MASWSSWSCWRSQALLGLDLADDSLRLVALEQRRGALMLCAAGTQALPPGCVVGGGIHEFDAVAAALEQLLAQHPCRTRDVAMALPTSSVRLDSWPAPLGLDDDALAALVAEQVAQRWSADAQDLSLDYGYVQGEGAGGLGHVWVAAAPLDLVQDRQGLAQACGLRLTDLESSAQASQRAWQTPAAAGAGAASGQVLELTQPFEGMRLGPRLAARGWPDEPAAYATACGLALRRFMP